MQDSVGLLGPLPPSWRVSIVMLEGVPRYVYVCDKTGAYTFADPRLGELGEWKPLETFTTGIFPADVVHFRHKTTGEVSDSDPRLDPDALRERGVRLKSFALV